MTRIFKPFAGKKLGISWIFTPVLDIFFVNAGYIVIPPLTSHFFKKRVSFLHFEGR